MSLAGEPHPTKLFDTFWRFAAERQAIFFRRLRGESPPWTTDPILSEYKFTNAYRASDRTSQFLIRQVQSRGSQLPAEIVYRMILFKLFNRIETWEFLEDTFGPLEMAGFSVDALEQALSQRQHAGERLYSAAYIMPPIAHVFPKHRGHLLLLQQMLDEKLSDRVQSAPSLKEVYTIFRGYAGIGPFLAFQLAIDMNYTRVINFSEMDFVVAGPGARRGLRKCFSDFGGRSEPDLLRWVTERQHEEFESRGLKFQSLWGRPLQLIDVQNLFCEIDKYSRALPGHGPRNRIKQRLRPKSGLPSAWFPPQWGLNEKITDQPFGPLT